MEPILTALSPIGVMVGMWLSWTIGWYFSDWVDTSFSYRVRANQEHLKVYKSSPPITPKNDFENAILHAMLSPNEVRKMQEVEENSKILATDEIDKVDRSMKEYDPRLEIVIKHEGKSSKRLRYEHI